MSLLETNFCGINMTNPVTVASGTFGSGMEYDSLLDIGALGAVTTKGVADQPWSGNPTPRICETPSGMLNAIGLQNPGVEVFIRRDLEFLKGFDTKIIVNVCGHSEEEYINVVSALAGEPVHLLEINISCPNVKSGGMAFGTDPRAVEHITRLIKDESAVPVVMKLSPNVTSIAEIARAAEAGGADGLSLINTITGMKIDTRTRKPLLANGTGGLSGPAIHPVAVRMVYEVYEAVDIPLIGIGGICDTEGALEMMMAGAAMVSVGTANFFEPDTAINVISGLEEYARENHLKNISEIVGAAH